MELVLINSEESSFIEYSLLIALEKSEEGQHDHVKAHVENALNTLRRIKHAEETK